MSRSLGYLCSFLVIVLLLGCMGLLWPIEIAVNLVIGWAFFLSRVREVHIQWGGIVVALVCLGLLSVGSHLFLRWLYGEIQGQQGQQAGKRWSRSWTASLIAIVVLMFVSGTAVVGVTHQAGWLLASRDPFLSNRVAVALAARRYRSMNNLKQMGLALHNYHGATEAFPPGGIFDLQGRGYHGWQTMILPHLEERELYNQINFDVPWSDPRNRTAFQTKLNSYLNPGFRSDEKDERGYALSHYAGNARMLGGNVPRTIADMTDGSAETILAGEVAGRFKPWGDPVNWRDPALGVNRSPEGFGSPYPQGATFLFGDGSIRDIKNSVDPRILKALSTPAGGEVVSKDGY